MTQRQTFGADCGLAMKRVLLSKLCTVHYSQYTDTSLCLMELTLAQTLSFLGTGFGFLYPRETGVSGAHANQ